MKRLRGNSMVGVLVTVAIILVLVVVLFKGGSVLGIGGSQKVPERADKKGKTVLGRSQLAAKDDVCRSNLGQVRLAIQVAQSSGEEQCPASLQDLKLSSDFLCDPIGKEPYVLDPTTCTVKCVHPGHEKY